MYCKKCKKLGRGKLRCRCSTCREGSFVLTQVRSTFLFQHKISIDKRWNDLFLAQILFIQGPNCWEDVLTKQRMQGRCESNKNCPGTTAVSENLCNLLTWNISSCLFFHHSFRNFILNVESIMIATNKHLYRCWNQTSEIFHASPAQISCKLFKLSLFLCQG